MNNTEYPVREKETSICDSEREAVVKTLLAGYEDVLRPSDLMKILRLGRNTIYKYLADVSIPSIHIAEKYIIPKCYIEDLIKNSFKTQNL